MKQHQNHIFFSTLVVVQREQHKCNKRCVTFSLAYIYINTLLTFTEQKIHRALPPTPTSWIQQQYQKKHTSLLHRSLRRRKTLPAEKNYETNKSPSHELTPLRISSNVDVNSRGPKDFPSSSVPTNHKKRACPTSNPLPELFRKSNQTTTNTARTLDFIRKYYTIPYIPRRSSVQIGTEILRSSS